MAAAAPAAPPSSGPDLPIEGKTVKAITLLSLKRTHDLFVGNHGQKVPLDEEAQKAKIACKLRDEYTVSQAFKSREMAAAARAGARPAAQPAAPAGADSKSHTAKLIDSIPAQKPAAAAAGKGRELVLHGGNAGHGQISQEAKAALGGTVMIPTAAGGEREYTPSATLARRLPSKWPRPAWHAPWRMYRVISGHLGWVRSVAFDPSNEWFVTGSADRTIKIWDTASGTLRLTLTGHIEQVTGLAVSPRHPCMFSCALDKMVKCWDLEQNKIIRNYHGHLSGVYCLAQHPTVDIIMTGGRDAACRVWDIRTKVQVHCLSGHEDTVAAVLALPTDPQVITASHDKTVRLWDLRMGKTLATLTHHKKAVRALVASPTEHTFCSGAADNMKKFKLPHGDFLHNFLQQQRAIVNCMAANQDGVVASGADNGSLWFWDYTSGNAFQQQDSIVQPGSLDSEAGIYAMSFDVTGSRLVTCEADKTIKMWKEDETATPESHPIDFRPPKDIKRF
ncbi:pleiotropic regulatory locus 1 [Micractinium conductrix]|uniref:Pleiotropic regulatory locus 1 n=1 Tax=Micractinium conductrix TaxID=554055 RepID=A0A2P6V073_9CHLO|nr:pleiotropic regulatory locus 1 [Micractinium conductrix]|eukprot:PSC67497.1 pleiotropic regulatory locus 1 [Micractinium conductrix]